MPSPFQQYCGKWPDIDSMQKLEKLIKKECIHPKVREVVEANFKRHTGTIPRWDTPDVPRTDPNYNERIITLPCAWNCGRTGPSTIMPRPPWGFILSRASTAVTATSTRGPIPSATRTTMTGRAWDYMTNVVIFGKNPYLVDIVGHWLGGHEPGNFGLFHIAMERGKLDVMNPMHIPVYEWQDGVAVRRPLTSFTRTPLRSFYLQQRAKEPLWHLGQPAVRLRQGEREETQHSRQADHACAQPALSQRAQSATGYRVQHP